MRVLVACEFSGIVREAFRARGHDAWSCDLLPTEIPGSHIQDDILSHLEDGWDLIIAHPPCTFLSGAGAHRCLPHYDGHLERIKNMESGYEFAMKIWSTQVSKIAMENPVGMLSRLFRKPDQIVKMNEFGHKEACKPTCLWLRGLPLLKATDRVEFAQGKWGNRESLWYSTTKRGKDRSRTFPGFAQAMASQWG